MPIEVWATDEHRIGLKPIIRRVWAPKGQRPIALGHHRYKWLSVTAFVQPLSGAGLWSVSTGVSKPFFAALLALFAREAGAGRERILVLGLEPYRVFRRLLILEGWSHDQAYQPVDEVLSWSSTRNMWWPKLRRPTLFGMVIAEKRLRQRPDMPPYS